MGKVGSNASLVRVATPASCLGGGAGWGGGATAARDARRLPGLLLLAAPCLVQLARDDGVKVRGAGRVEEGVDHGPGGVLQGWEGQRTRQRASAEVRRRPGCLAR